MKHVYRSSTVPGTRFRKSMSQDMASPSMQRFSTSPIGGGPRYRCLKRICGRDKDWRGRRDGRTSASAGGSLAQYVLGVAHCQNADKRLDARLGVQASELVPINLDHVAC